MPNPHLSVIIPSYNEIKNIQRGVLDEVVSFLSQQEYTWEVILSDDGSSDGTLAELERFAKKHAGVSVLDNPHAGKGPTVQAGMLAARGDWRLFTDFDQSTPLSEIMKLFQYVPEYDIVIGSREIRGARRDEEPWYRHLMGRGFNWLVQLIAIPGIYDTQCGFKLLSAQAAESLFSQLYIYGANGQLQGAFTGAFDVEILYLARKNDYRIKEVPIEWHHHETDRVSPVRDSIRMFRDIVRIRVADLFGHYDLEN